MKNFYRGLAILLVLLTIAHVISLIIIAPVIPLIITVIFFFGLIFWAYHNPGKKIDTQKKISYDEFFFQCLIHHTQAF